ncbi:hypothetical protein [Ferrovibrio sp.]|uniref:hypothetical protein n=1 Tax=Ferrovibrio sp. TaxID=1917215 RepID=UPI002626FF5B|nr:hypothetical protein [Ferrovibrio sp.]
MRITLRKLFMLPLLAGLLAACSADREVMTPATQALALGVGIELVKTRIERRLEMTCNPLNMISDGTYCVSNYKPTDRQEVWCFKTLAGVDCYAEPDPYSLEGRALPAAPRPLADPRMPMTPPGRRNPPQVAVAPVGSPSEPDQPMAAEPVQIILTEPPPATAPKPM